MYTKLYKIRRELNISQEQLAELSKVSQANISKIEKGIIKAPAADKIMRIAEALNVNVAELMDEATEVQPAFRSFTQAQGTAVFIPLYNEKQPMSQTFDKGDGFVLRAGNAAQTQIRKPSFLDYSGEAYAAVNFGSVMEPRYFSGDTLFVDPTLDAQPKDDIVLMFQQQDKIVGIFRELVELTEDKVIAQDVRSGKPVHFNKADLYAVHVVVGSQRSRSGG